jgi:hypothetical protein
VPRELAALPPPPLHPPRDAAAEPEVRADGGGTEDRGTDAADVRAGADVIGALPR